MMQVSILTNQRQKVKRTRNSAKEGKKIPFSGNLFLKLRRKSARKRFPEKNSSQGKAEKINHCFLYLKSIEVRFLLFPVPGMLPSMELSFSHEFYSPRAL